MVKSNRFFSLIVGCALLVVPSSAKAQLVPDTTLGDEGSSISPNVDVDGNPADLIEGGATRGSNLFHSFQEFNVIEGQRVFFANPGGILNIFSRVTGNNPSNILGTLGVDGYANLLLINPNGIVFGPNAQLDIPASFTASTAESFTFEDGQTYSAVDPNAPPILQLNITPGLQYGNQQAELTNQGNLETGQNLTLGAFRLNLAGEFNAGRDIILQGQERFLSDANYTVGGYLFTQDLSSAGIDLLIPHENVIVATGDVRFEENYAGPSLYVLAGGQVSQSEAATEIEITGPAGGTVTETIADGAGGTQIVTVRASNEPTVDIRSDVEWNRLISSQPQNSNNSEWYIIFQDVLEKGISIGNVINNGGRISLQSADIIEAGNLDSSITILSPEDYVIGNNPGSISLESNRNLTVGNLFSFSYIELENGDDITAKPGGEISIISNGNVSTLDINSSSFSLSTLDTPGETGEVIGGQGGNIEIYARGYILTSDLGSFSTSASASPSADLNGNVVGENGGEITLVSGSTIVIADLNSSSSSLSASFGKTGDVSGGNGGTILLVARENIFTWNINSHSEATSFSRAGLEAGEILGGQGGEILLFAGGDIASYDLESYSDSRSASIPISSLVLNLSGNVRGGNGGRIRITAGGNISADLLNSSSSSSSLSFENSSGDVLGSYGGDVFLDSGGNILLTSIDSSSSSGSFSNLSSSSGDVYGSNGGDIVLIARGDITAIGFTDTSFRTYTNLNSSSYSSSDLSGNVMGGNGGAIILIGGNNIVFGEINSTSTSFSNSVIDTLLSGNGGSVVAAARQNLNLGRISTFSLSTPDAINTSFSGNGGTIDLIAGEGSILFQPDLIGEVLDQAELFTFSVSGSGDAGLGGDVLLQTSEGISNIEILTTSSSSSSGNISILGLDHIDINNVSFVASKTVEIKIPVTPSVILLPVGREGQPGNITIRGNRNLSFESSSFLNTTNGIDSAGNVLITSPGELFLNNTIILSEAENVGPAGNITLNAPQITIDENSQISTSTVDAGLAGNIAINAEVLTLINGGQILATTAGEGDGGSVTINATEAVRLGEGVQDFAPIISVETSGAGRPGNIAINTPNFLLSETARITATATATATNPEGGGSITLSADQMDLAGTVGIFAETEGQAPGGILTLQPYQSNPDLGVTLAPGAIISASTSGSGNGGDLRVLAPERITITGPGRLAVETSGSGQAGNIEIVTQQLSLLDGVTLSASTTGTGAAGNVSLTADSLSFQEGARVISNTFGSGRAGDIALNVGNTLTFDNATAAAATEAGSTGIGGNISLDADNIVVRNNGRIAVTSQGQGQGGNITLSSNRLTFDQGQMVAETLSSNGGELNLIIADLLLLRNQSLISATAGTGQAGGNGGNITINAGEGFIIAFPEENSDITANAFDGNGGNITITTQGLFGLEFRDQLTPFSDITASSNFGLSGSVTLNSPDSGIIENSLTEFPDIPLPTNQLLVGSCIARTADDQGSFVVTGAGGLPQSPGQGNFSSYPTGQVRTPQQEPTSGENVWQPGMPIAEPDGVYSLGDGRLVLSRECD
jgi:filamentous hemagglutinin family protein